MQARVHVLKPGIPIRLYVTLGAPIPVRKPNCSYTHTQTRVLLYRHTSTRASDLAYTLGSPRVKIRLKGHLGLHTGIRAPGLVYKYRGIRRLSKLAYNLSNGTLHVFHTRLCKTGRENQGNITSCSVHAGATVQVLAYRYMHISIRRLVCVKCIYMLGLIYGK